MSGKGRFYGCRRKNLSLKVGHEKGEKLSFVEGFLSPLTNLGMGSTDFTGITGKFFPQGVDHGKVEKLRSGDSFFDGCDFRNISSLVKRWEPVFMGVIGEKFIRSIRWRTSPPH